MVINKALLKYGYSKFKLDILEYCNVKELVNREQHYMNLLSPEYNVLNKAYSSLGYKHTKNSLVKVRNNLNKLNLNKSIKVKVTNLQTNVFKEYPSITEAAINLNTNKNTLKEYILNSKIYKGIYKLESNISPSNFDSNYLNHPNSKKIKVIDLELDTINYYDSIRAAARALNIGHSSIAIYLKRNQKSSYKGRFIFNYID